MTVCVPASEDLALIRQAVREAGTIAREAFYACNSKVWDKEKGHPVTDADIAVNNYLARTLKTARPDYGWLSEETRDDHSRHACPRTFVVDPIDGTRAFIDRSPHFTISVAIIQNGQTLVAALYNPITNEMYEALKGGGAQLNGHPIHVQPRTQLEGCRMVGYPRKFRRLGWPDMNVSIINSMAYRIARVASGAADATVAFTPKSDWDLAAAELIAREAGAIVTDLRGQAFRYDQQSTSEFGVICSGPVLHPLLLKRIAPMIAKYNQGPDHKTDFKDLGTLMSDRNENPVQLLHLVIGGELVDPNRTEFKDLKAVDFVGAYGNYATAHDAWKAAAQRTVDNAHMRYFILHAHELIDPNKDGVID